VNHMDEDEGSSLLKRALRALPFRFESIGGFPKGLFSDSLFREAGVGAAG
jgi:hypothetical protein